MRRRLPPLALLVLLAAVSPLSTDLYTPAFPAVAVSLGTPEAAVQLTFSLFIIGMGVGQVLVGPVSDGIGRRPFLVGGTVLFTAASVTCALAPDITVLLGARLLQGLAGAACLVMARATITDSYEGVLAARRFATVAGFQSFVPVAGPALGAAILLVGDWRSIFVLVAALGAVMTVGTLVAIPESLPPERRSGAQLRDSFVRMRKLLRDRRFTRYVVTSAFACAGFFSYIAGAPLVLHSVFGTTSQQYGLFFAVNALGMAGMIALLRYLAVRTDVRRLLFTGLVIAVCASGALSACALAGAVPIAVVWMGLFGVTCGVGFINPAALILSQRAGAVFAGTAAALHGGIQFTSGALASPSTGLLGHESVLPMALVIFTFMSLALIANRLGARLDRPATT